MVSWVSLLWVSLSAMSYVNYQSSSSSPWSSSPSRDGDRFVTGNLTAGERGTNWMHEMGGSSAQVMTRCEDDFCNNYLLKELVVIISIPIVESSCKWSHCSGRSQEQAVLQHQWWKVVLFIFINVDFFLECADNLPSWYLYQNIGHIRICLPGLTIWYPETFRGVAIMGFHPIRYNLAWIEND